MRLRRFCAKRTARFQVRRAALLLAALALPGIARARQTSSLPEQVRAEEALGARWQTRGFAHAAIAHLDRALEAAQRGGDPALVADVYGALAAAYGDLGQWDRSLDYTERQREADHRRGPELEFRYLFQRGVASAEFHEYAKARTALEQALATARGLRDPRRISMSLGELGAVAIDADHDLSRALGFYDEALDIARRARLTDLEATWLVDSGAALREADDYRGARLRFEHAIALERARGVRRVTPAALKNLAQVLLHDGKRQRAAELFRQSQREADEQNLPQLRWEVRVERAALARDDRPDEAERLFDEALDILEDAQSGVLVEQLRTGAISRALASADPYDLAIDLLLTHGRVSKAFFVAERGRARAFLEALRPAGDAILHDLPAEYVEAEASLLADISEGQAALRVVRMPSDDRRALEGAIRSDEARLETLRLRLAADVPAVAHVRYPQLWRAEDLGARLLKPNQALLMFFLGAGRSTCWVVRPDGLQAVTLARATEIEAATREYLQIVRQPAAARERDLASALFQLLLGDVTLPASVDDLIVIPHGILSDLPFEALRDGTGRRLVERFAVQYAPSASSFALLAGRGAARGASSTVLAIGNPVTSSRDTSTRREVQIGEVSLLKPLPFTELELHAIARLFGRPVRILEGAAATEQALRDADLSSVSILHFATHGLIDEGQPERSALVLTASPPRDDGVLQVREIYRLKLRSALVTLSACDTALGQHVRGEGIIGLSRAFFYAGADAVVASLWSVNDRSTARFMTEFYSGLARGAPAHLALRQAKLRLLSDQTWHEPFYWAAFILTGNGAWQGAPAPAPQSRWIAWSVAAASASAAVVWLTVRRRRGRTSVTRSR
jgi:CHAT domain-containing protein